MFLQASLFARQICCSQSHPTNSTRDCNVMRDEVLLICCITYCIVENNRMPCPLAAFVLFYFRRADVKRLKYNKMCAARSVYYFPIYFIILCQICGQLCSAWEVGNLLLCIWHFFQLCVVKTFVAVLKC